MSNFFPDAITSWNNVITHFDNIPSINTLQSDKPDDITHVFGKEFELFVRNRSMQLGLITDLKHVLSWTF